MSARLGLLASSALIWHLRKAVHRKLVVDGITLSFRDKNSRDMLLLGSLVAEGSESVIQPSKMAAIIHASDCWKQSIKFGGQNAMENIDHPKS